MTRPVRLAFMLQPPWQEWRPGWPVSALDASRDVQQHVAHAMGAFGGPLAVTSAGGGELIAGEFSMRARNSDRRAQAAFLRPIVISVDREAYGRSIRGLF